jgi:hypothetical protein
MHAGEALWIRQLQSHRPVTARTDEPLSERTQLSMRPASLKSSQRKLLPAAPVHTPRGEIETPQFQPGLHTGLVIERSDSGGVDHE